MKTQAQIIASLTEKYGPCPDPLVADFSSAWAYGHVGKMLLDGKRHEFSPGKPYYAVALSVREGWIDFVDRDENVSHLEDASGMLITFRKHGKVEVIFEE